jgi:hypothetical protein
MKKTNFTTNSSDKKFLFKDRVYIKESTEHWFGGLWGHIESYDGERWYVIKLLDSDKDYCELLRRDFIIHKGKGVNKI